MERVMGYSVLALGILLGSVVWFALRGFDPVSRAVIVSGVLLLEVFGSSCSCPSSAGGPAAIDRRAAAPRTVALDTAALLLALGLAALGTGRELLVRRSYTVEREPSRGGNSGRVVLGARWFVEARRGCRMAHELMLRNHV
jgi:hypothetical protein